MIKQLTLTTNRFLKNMHKQRITKSQREKLDRLFQQKKLEQTPESEISGDPADCVHHFFRKSDGMRWYLPGGVSLTAEEHNIIDSSDPRSQEYEELIIKSRGTVWYANLIKRKFQPVKYLTYERVLAHLNGQALDYI